MRPLSRRRLLVAFALVMGSTACARAQHAPPTVVPAAAGLSATRRNTLRPVVTASPTPAPPTPVPTLASVTITLPGNPDTLNPLLSTSPAARALASLVLDGLVRAGPDGLIQPSLAADWQSTDGHAYTFHIRPDARWHDGQPVTSADAVYTVNLLTDANSPIAADLRVAWRGISAHAIDPSTVVLTAPASVGAGLLDLATTPLLPSHSLASTSPADLPRLSYSQQPLGTSTYAVRSADSFQVVLERVASDGTAPRHVIVDFTGSAAPTVAALPPDQASVTLPAFGGPLQVGVTSSIAPLARPVFLFLNQRRDPLSDVRVRRALAQAVARGPLIAGPLRHAAMPVFLPVLPTWWGADDDAHLPDSVPDEAESQLGSAGWVPGPLGVRQRGSAPLSLTLLVDDDAARLAVAQAVVAAWRRIGVQATVQAAGLDGLLRDFALPGHFDALLLGVSQQGVMPSLIDLWHSGGAMNLSGWADPLADAALDATRSPDVSTRRTGYTSFQQRFADQIPAIPLYVPAVRIAARGVSVVAPIMNDPADVTRTVPLWRPARSGAPITLRAPLVLPS